MLTINLKKFGEVMKVKRLQISEWNDKHFSWCVVNENGVIHSLGLSASGKDCFRKKDFKVNFIS